MKKIAVQTFGCKVNQYETACSLDKFLDNGYKLVNFSETADIYLINTCTVTNRTDYKSRNAIRKALKQKQKYPKTNIIITGCYAQRFPEEIRSIGKIDYIIDNNNKGNIYDIVVGNQKINFNKIEFYHNFGDVFTKTIPDKTRAFIKIQDGCSYNCSYCAIPFARGKSRSRDKVDILSQIKVLAKNGYKEIILSGINLGLYGKDKKNNYSLPDLIMDIEKIKQVEIIRLSSIEPDLFDDSLFRIMKTSKKLAPHFHIPLQSGCDKILAKMKRRYNQKQFKQLVDKIYKIKPYAALGLDVIVGFPGESKENFLETKKFLENIKFTYLHLFSYSKRPKTSAAKMKNQVNGNIIKKRNSQLRKLSQQKTRKYSQKLVENRIILKGIIESKEKGYYTALSDHYMRVYFQSEQNLQNKFMKFIPKKNFRDGLVVDRVIT